LGRHCRPEAVKLVIFQLQLKLFVEIVPKVGADEVTQGLVVDLVHLGSPSVIGFPNVSLGI